MDKIYAGIGSRETPFQIQNLMQAIGIELGKNGYTLRSGGADGADKAFEMGCDSVNGKKEIFIPWKNFNGSNSELYDCTHEAFTIAKKYHPAWDRLKEGAQKLMARNGYQVLGYNLETCVDFVVVWTKDGKASGGSGQAMRIAKDKKIKIYNLFSLKETEELLTRIRQMTTLNIFNL